MRTVHASLALLTVLAALPAAAEEADFPPLQPLDLTDFSPEMAADMFGGWTIADASGKRTCHVELMKEMGIGGMQIVVDPACERAFPVMAEITAWRLMESWTIDLVDIGRNTRVRFSTPDERYVAIPDVDGIDTISKD